ncbi:sulfatase-like hydrolase/transferase [bacterium]|nr:sulfatase-like hydrolase/transferase [bacterium]
MKLRGKFYLIAVLSLAGLGALSSARPQTPRAKPNIVLLIADQLRQCSMSYAGNAQIITPHLDRLAQQGTRIMNCVSNLTLCTPYRAMLMTGRYSHTLGIFKNHAWLPIEEQSLAEALREHGYACGYLGKWHLAGEEKFDFIPPGPLRQGWDEFWAAYNFGDTHSAQKYLLGDSPVVRVMPGHSADGFTDYALQFIDTHKDRPFVLVVAWAPPHNPYLDVPDSWKSMYSPSEIVLRPNFAREQAEFQQKIAGYYALTTNLDWNVGRILARLDSLGLADDTIVVFTSDHGDMLGSQGHEFKQRPWHESTHVPLIIRYPGVVLAGRETDLLFNTPDFMPTLFGLAGIPIPPTVDGADLSAFLRGESDEQPASAYIYNPQPFPSADQFIPPWEGVVTKRFTYVLADSGHWLLYDNTVDPYQLDNLIFDPAFAAVRDSLHRILQQWMRRFGDTFPNSVKATRGSQVDNGFTDGLDYAMPNPFRKTTLAQFTLARPSQVTLRLFNIAGQEVATIFQGEMRAGRHQVYITMTDLASGVYFLRLETTSHGVTRKIIMLP